MAWKGVITNAGQELLSQFAAGGHTLHLDGAKVGSGTVDEANMRIATGLVSEEDTASIISAEAVTGGTKIKVQVGPAVSSPYNAHEIGIWAHIDNGQSVLLSLHQDSDGGVGVPLASVSPDFAFGLYALIATSNTGTIQVNIDTSALVSLGTMTAALDEVQKRYDDALASIGLYVDDGDFYILDT